MEEVKSPQISVFVSHIYVQHEGTEWCGEHRTRYHSFLPTARHDLQDAVAFTYEDSTALGSKKAAVSFQRDWTLRSRTRIEGK